VVRTIGQRIIPGYLLLFSGQRLSVIFRNISIAFRIIPDEINFVKGLMDGIGFAGPFHPEVTLQEKLKAACAAFNVHGLMDGIGFAGPFHPEVTLQEKLKAACAAAFVFKPIAYAPAEA